MTSDFNKWFAVAQRPPVAKFRNAVPKDSSVANLFMLNGVKLITLAFSFLFSFNIIVYLSTYFQYQTIFLLPNSPHQIKILLFKSDLFFLRNILKSKKEIKAKQNKTNLMWTQTIAMRGNSL